MADEERIQPGEVDLRFLTLIMSLATRGLVAAGQDPHPTTQKIEKDMEQAKMSIDFLRMLLEKNQGKSKTQGRRMLVEHRDRPRVELCRRSEETGRLRQKDPDLIIPSGAGGKGPEIIKP